MIQAAIYVKKRKLTRQGEAPMFRTDGFLTAFNSIPLTGNAQYTSDKLTLNSMYYGIREINSDNQVYDYDLDTFVECDLIK